MGIGNNPIDDAHIEELVADYITSLDARIAQLEARVLNLEVRQQQTTM